MSTNFEHRARKAMIYGAITGFGLSIVLVGFVVATGQTFGQRCTAMGYDGTAKEKCIEDFSSGKIR